MLYWWYQFVQRCHHGNGDADTPTSAWTSWSVDATTDLGQRSPGQSSQGQRSQSPLRPGVAAQSLLVPGVTSQPGAHQRCYDDDVTSHELLGVSPSSNVPSTPSSECRLSSPTTPFTTCYENVSCLAFQSASCTLKLLFYFSTVVFIH